MKKTIMTACILVVAGIAALIFLISETPERKAKSAESKGDYKSSAKYYSLSFFKLLDSRSMPDKNRARILDTDKWNSEVSEYLSWVTESKPERNSQTAGAALEKLRGICERVENVHYMTYDSVFEYTEEWMLAEDWDRAFFPANTTLVKNQSALVRRAITDGVSILRIRSLTSYSYEISLIDLTSFKKTDFNLAPEDEVSVLLRPQADYLLILTSRVEFPDGKIWQSPVNLIDIKAPEKSSLRTFVLAGKISRLE